MEVRTNIYDMISSIGGTLGLFTGISVITLVEVFYWMCQFFLVCFNILKEKCETLKVNGFEKTPKAKAQALRALAENGPEELHVRKDSGPGGSKVSFK